MASAASATAGEVQDYKLGKVIVASSVGTLIEWYDFYIFGSLAAILATLFYPQGNETAALLATLATFATGFVVRPFGAAFFGRIGDLVGRKFTFLMTISLMGGATFVIGLLPTYESIGIAAPIILVLLRLLQGLALGGEYGGAAIYVAEHAPDRRRGFFTSFIQTTATLGLLLSLGVILAVRTIVGVEAFETWGWRIPFLLSGLLLGVALWIRFSLKETPLFAKLKAAGKTSTKPLKDAFAGGRWKLMALALFGATAGQGVIWYTGQFYALFFMQNVLHVDLATSSLVVGAAIVLGTPFFLVFGALSDRIGRKRIILTGCVLGALTYVPLFRAMTGVVSQTGGEDPVGTITNIPLMILIITVMVLYVTMVYGPIAAFLVELFPGNIRYTSLSLPYHIGNGVFGGLVPFIAAAIVASTGNNYAGLIYPISVAVVTVIVGSIFLRETYTTRIYEEVGVLAEPTPDREVTQPEARTRESARG